MWCGIISIVTIKTKVYHTIDTITDTTKKTITSILKQLNMSSTTKITPDIGDDDAASIKLKLHDYIYSFVPDIYSDKITSSLRRYIIIIIIIIIIVVITNNITGIYRNG